MYGYPKREKKSWLGTRIKSFKVDIRIKYLGLKVFYSKVPSSEPNLINLSYVAEIPNLRPVQIGTTYTKLNNQEGFESVIQIWIAAVQIY